MRANLLPERPSYKSSGGVNWLRFVPWLLLALVGSAVLAGLMFLLFKAGHYYIIFVPLVAAVGVAGLMNLVVAKGHCRNRLVAALCGLLAGCVLYFGYYYIGMVYALGTEMAAHPRVLPAYIRFRMATDVLRDTHDYHKHDDEEPSRARGGSSFSNWMFFWIETVLVLGLSAGGALVRARKTYCEKCGRWMLREVTQFEPQKSDQLVQAFQVGSARQLAELCVTPVYSTLPNTSLALEYCPSMKDGRGQDCSSYFSVKRVDSNPGGATLDNFEHTKGKMLVRSAQVKPDELPALALRFPFLESHTGRSAVAALRPAAAAVAEEDQKPGVFGDIKEFDAGERGTVMTPKSLWIGTALGASALLAFFGGLLLMVLGGVIAFPTSTAPSTPNVILGVTLMVAGGLVFVLSMGLVFVNPSYFGNRYLLKKLKAQLSRRTGCLVEPNDPDALFIEIVPKMNWGKMALDNAQDVGLFKVDRSRKELLFEGDKGRWRIPVAALTHCEVEKFVEAKGSHAATKVFYVVLRVAHPSRFWEAPIQERTGHGIFRSGRRKKSANALYAQIRELQGAQSTVMVGK